MVKDNRLIDGRAVQKRILEDVRCRIEKLHHIQPIGSLVSVSIGDRPEVAVYIRNQAKAASIAGIPFHEVCLPKTISSSDARAEIKRLNDDPNVVGVILQRPVPEHINVRILQHAVHPRKDVEGMNPASIGNIVYDDVGIAPCTAAAALELLRETGLSLEGLEVVLIGHSAIVGKPAAFLLMAAGATVTVCHHMTRSVTMHSRRADAVIVAVGIPKFLGADMVKPGAAVIDIGINQVVEPDGRHRIIGDADTEAIKQVASWVTPVPGGVGPVTVGILMRNTVEAHTRRISAMGESG